MRTRAFIYAVAGAAAGFSYALVTLVSHLTGSELAEVHLLLAPVLGGVFAYMLGREHDETRASERLLREAKENFTVLTHQAVSSRDWDVSFHDSRIDTCWKAKRCAQDDCPAYGQEHIRCWLLAGTFCRGEVQGHFALKLDSCVECSVYQNAVANDPIREIGENFNSLMWSLREKEDLLAEAKHELEDQYAKLEDLQRQTEELAITDALTGVRNHGHFQQTLEAEVSRAKRYEGPFSLVMVDLDHFKTVNDRFGHQKGDSVLRKVGKLLRDATRDVDYVARYGGEEFVIIMPEIAGEEAVKTAERLREQIKHLVAGWVGLPRQYIGASFGVADFPRCAGDGSSLISAADAALLFSKRKGRNRVAYFRDLSDTELGEDDLERLHSRLEGVGLQTIAALAEAVDTSEQYDSDQRAELAGIAAVVARKLNMDDEKIEALALATRLHDIGKVGVPGSILRKKDKLSADELDRVQQHPEIGQRILREAEKVQDLISAILYHHERWDGNGYPERLKGKEIPVMARVVGIIDAYRAMTSNRPYRRALSLEQAVAELRNGAGTQFDPTLVEYFVEALTVGSPDEGQEISEAV